MFGMQPCTYEADGKFVCQRTKDAPLEHFADATPAPTPTPTPAVIAFSDPASVGSLHGNSILDTNVIVACYDSARDNHPGTISVYKCPLKTNKCNSNLRSSSAKSPNPLMNLYYRYSAKDGKLGDPKHAFVVNRTDLVALKAVDGFSVNIGHNTAYMLTQVYADRTDTDFFKTDDDPGRTIKSPAFRYSATDLEAMFVSDPTLKKVVFHDAIYASDLKPPAADKYVSPNPLPTVPLAFAAWGNGGEGSKVFKGGFTASSRDGVKQWLFWGKDGGCDCKYRLVYRRKKNGTAAGYDYGSPSEELPVKSTVYGSPSIYFEFSETRSVPSDVKLVLQKLDVSKGETTYRDIYVLPDGDIIQRPVGTSTTTTALHKMVTADFT